VVNKRVDVCLKYSKNSPTRIFNSKIFPGVITPDPRQKGGGQKGGKGKETGGDCVMAV